MLKRASSGVLASLKACDVREKVRLGFSLAAALLDGLFEHPGRHLGHDQWACFTEPC
jgi:hypothetical protein